MHHVSLWVEIDQWPCRKNSVQKRLTGHCVVTGPSGGEKEKGQGFGEAGDGMTSSTMESPGSVGGATQASITCRSVSTPTSCGGGEY